MRRTLCLSILFGLVLPLAAQDAAFEKYYDGELVANLRWQLNRLRDDREREDARVGVFADAGVWHLGARSVVEALEDAGIDCRVLAKDQLSERGLRGLRVLIFPGGWAPYQIEALGDDGPEVIRAFVRGGGTYFGICAGAYLAADDVEYAGTLYPYPLDLIEGEAEGPVPGLPLYPEVANIELSATGAGRERGLPRSMSALFQGGCTFDEEEDDVTVLARYAGGDPAVISVPYGRGEVVLSGAHFERPPVEEGGTDATTPPPRGCGKLFRSLLRLER